MWGIAAIIFGLIELIVGLRFVFQLLGANTASALVAWVYDVSAPLVAPFTGIFGHAVNPTGGAVSQSVFEPATLIALLVYGLIGGLILRMLAPRSIA